MPLQVAKAPMAAQKAVHSMVARMVATDNVSALRSASPTSVAISTPHRVAVLDLDRIHSGMSLRAAAHTKGWRFLVHNGDKVVATANSSLKDKGKHGFTHITDGKFVSGTERAIRRAERLDSVRNGRFEPLLLQVPAIHVVALWLRNLDKDDDLLMPISPVPKPLRAYHAVSTRDFVAVLSQLATQVQRDHAEAHRRRPPRA
jgi:hypothetical protein